MYVQYVRSGDRSFMEDIKMCWGYPETLIIVRKHNSFYYKRLHVSTF